MIDSQIEIIQEKNNLNNNEINKESIFEKSKDRNNLNSVSHLSVGALVVPTLFYFLS